MKIDRRITNGLAWAGVVLVVGVPVADVVSAQLMGERVGGQTAQVAMIEPVAPAAEPAAPVQVAPVPVAASERPAAPAAKPEPVVAATPVPAAPVTPAPAAEDTVQTGSVVDNYLKSGKALPGYITGADSAPPPVVPSQPKAAASVAAPVADDPVAVATLGSSKVAPIPMPLSMRPEPVLIVPDQNTSRSIQVSPSANPRSSASVTYDDLSDWESGPLSEFLAKRQRGRAVDPNYDPDGFFLDQGPNRGRQGDRLIGPADEVFFPFAD